MDELPVVICTEVPDNEGMSITNAAEQIANEVLANHPDVFSTLAPYSTPGSEYDKPFVWIEHYEDGARGTPEDPATFDLVEFSRYEPKDVVRAGEWGMEIGEPSRSPLDRATVERLVGETLNEGRENTHPPLQSALRRTAVLPHPPRRSSLYAQTEVLCSSLPIRQSG